MDILASFGGTGLAVLGYVVPFLFVLTLVVFVHEFGHFIVGRWCGVDVKTFSIGFGRELFGFNDRHGTRWRFALIPLGGYVKFSGDADVSSAPDQEAVGRMTAQERERSFPAQSIGERAAIVAAGPIANFILAIAIFAASAFIFGKPVLSPRVDSLVAGSAAEQAGLKPGDLVVAIDGHEIHSFADMQRIVSMRPGERIDVTVTRAGSEVTLPVTPALSEVNSPIGKQRIGVIGVRASSGRRTGRPSSSACSNRSGKAASRAGPSSRRPMTTSPGSCRAGPPPTSSRGRSASRRSRGPSPPMPGCSA